MSQTTAAIQDDAHHREWLRQQIAKMDTILVSKPRVSQVVNILQARAKTHRGDLLLQTCVEELVFLLGIENKGTSDTLAGSGDS